MGARRSNDLGSGHAPPSMDAFKLAEVPTGDEAVMFSVSLGLVSLLVPLGVFAFGNRFFGAANRRLSVPAYT